MATKSLSIPIASSSCWNVKSEKCYSPSLPLNSKPDWLVNSLLGNQLSLHSRPLLHKNRRSTFSTLSSTLQTETPVKASSEKTPKWSSRAIRSMALAQQEAYEFCYEDTGTESLLMGILIEGTSLASKFLRANGITLARVEEETIKLLGKATALHEVAENPVWTKPARRAFDHAVEEKLKSGDSGEITTTYLLLGMWAQKGYAAHRIMEKLGFNDEKAAELAKTKDKDVILSYR